MSADDVAVTVGMSLAADFAADPEPLDLSEEELSACAGRYASPDVAATLRVEGGQLLVSIDHPPVPDLIHPAIQDPPPTDVPVSMISGERLAVGSFLVGAIVRRPDGAVGWLRISTLSLPRIGDG